MKHLHIDATNGIAGDMFLAALLKNTPEAMGHRSLAAFEEALGKMPLESSRVRLRYIAANPE